LEISKWKSWGRVLAKIVTNPKYAKSQESNDTTNGYSLKMSYYVTATGNKRTTMIHWFVENSCWDCTVLPCCDERSNQWLLVDVLLGSRLKCSSPIYTVHLPQNLYLWAVKMLTPVLFLLSGNKWAHKTSYCNINHFSTEPVLQIPPFFHLLKHGCTHMQLPTGRCKQCTRIFNY
jgi:hypothetical protein